MATAREQPAASGRVPLAPLDAAIDQGSAKASRAARNRAALLAGLEWALLLAALGVWAGSRWYTPAMNAGSGLLMGSWAVRWLRTGAITRATRLDMPLCLFLLTAVVGLWAAPNRTDALVRLYLFIGAAGLFYALANVRGAGLTLAAAGLTLAGALLSIYFATQHDWSAETVKFDVVRRTGLLLNQFVPDLGAYKPHSNVVAGALGVLAPIAMALFGVSVGRLRSEHTLVPAAYVAAASVGAAAITAGLVMTESRAAWLGLASAVGVLCLWLLAAAASRASAGRWSGLVLFSGAFLSLATVAAVLFARNPNWLTLAFGSLPGPNSVANRLEIFSQVWRLSQDTPYTGGGLGAFPALYSTYVLDIPFLLLTHAHNDYLNLLVEQGWPGLLAFVAILSGAALAGFHALAHRPTRWRPWVLAGVAGLVVVGAQGLGDATLVASRAVVLLFVPAAFVMAPGASSESQPKRAMGRRWRWLAVAGTIAVLLAGAIFWRRPLLAAWYWNQGAVAFARVDLAGWPTNQWPDGSQAEALRAAEPALGRALSYEAGARTAHHRLGLRQRLALDFAAAVAELSRAHRADPGHRGITKALGYSYLWAGQLDEAQPLLALLPEARSELDVYAWWWGERGRADLANRARQMIQRMDR